MPSQQQIADHLDLNQSNVSRMLDELGIDWHQVSMDEIRVAYIRQLRGIASGHKSHDGLDLTRERVLTERVDRELKTLTVAEKKGTLVNVAQLEAELMQMVGAFRSELLSRDDKLKSELDALYGIDLDLNLLNEHTLSTMAQLARYDSSECIPDASRAGRADAAGAVDNNRVGAPVPEHVGQSHSTTGEI